jgi:hypothetical protein
LDSLNALRTCGTSRASYALDSLNTLRSGFSLTASDNYRPINREVTGKLIAVGIQADVEGIDVGYKVVLNIVSGVAPLTDEIQLRGWREADLQHRQADALTYE